MSISANALIVNGVDILAMLNTLSAASASFERFKSDVLRNVSVLQQNISQLQAENDLLRAEIRELIRNSSYASSSSSSPSTTTLVSATSCSFSDWGTWTPCVSLSTPGCDVAGFQTRQRVLIVPPVNGGTPCPPMVENRTCITPPLGCDSSGQYQLSTVYTVSSSDYKVYLSSDYGSSHQILSPPSNIQWFRQDMSQDGRYITLAACNAIVVSTSFGRNWTRVANMSLCFQSLRMSSDGRYQLAGVQQGNLYLSVNFGASWSSVITGNSSTYWTNAAMSQSGKYMLIAHSNGYGPIYSSNNSGEASSWVTIQGPTVGWGWVEVVVSASGQYQAAVCGNPGLMFFSNNYGQTWKTLFPGEMMASVAFSTSANIMLAASSAWISSSIGNISLSTDSGATWNYISGIPAANWYDIAVSSSGQYMTGVTVGRQVYISSTSGSSWAVAFTLPLGSQFSLSMSKSGRYQTICGSVQYVSSDYGVTWSVSALSSGPMFIYTLRPLANMYGNSTLVADAMAIHTSTSQDDGITFATSPSEASNSFSGCTSTIW